MSVGENIKIYRKEKGLTQKQLGSSAELSANSIRRYELGQRQPNIEILNKISVALNISISELLGVEKIGTSDTYVSDDGKVTHVYPKTNIENPKLKEFDDITLISEYIGRKADKHNHIIGDWKSIINDVNNTIEGDIAKGILKRGTKID